MNKEIIYTKNAPQAIGPYEQAIKAGGLIFLSGQIPLDPKTNLLLSGDIRKQTIQVMENLKYVLEASGSSIDKVLKTTIYLTDLSSFDIVNSVYGDYFKNSKPARSTVEVSALPKGALLEIDLIALA